jgi:hypothetical protein
LEKGGDGGYDSMELVEVERRRRRVVREEEE